MSRTTVRPRIYSDEDRRERKREEDKKYRESRTEEQKEYQRTYSRAWRESRTEEQKERQRAETRKWRANMTEEQEEHQRALQRKWQASLSEEQKEHRRAATRKWRANLSEEQKEYQCVTKRAWARANLDKRRENRKPPTEAQRVAKKTYDLAYMVRLTDEQRAEITARVQARGQGERDSLSDAYVKKLLKCSVSVPQELIELKRINLKIRRYLYQGEQR